MFYTPYTDGFDSDQAVCCCAECGCEVYADARSMRMTRSISSTVNRSARNVCRNLPRAILPPSV